MIYSKIHLHQQIKMAEVHKKIRKKRRIRINKTRKRPKPKQWFKSSLRVRMVSCKSPQNLKPQTKQINR
jgi:hypothetical protein